MRRGAKTAKTKVKAKLPVARKPLKNNGSRVGDLEKRLAEALEQQTATAEVLQMRNRELAEAHERETATAEILQVIAGSPTDIRSVFQAMAQSAAQLCESLDTSIFRLDGEGLRLVAHHGPILAGRIGEYSLPLDRGTVTGRSVLERRTVHVTDIQAESDEFPEGSERARHRGHRAILSVPLMLEGIAIGAIGLRRTEAQPFTDRQVALLQTFAAQAVIAIENVRLFNETKESLDQQTATAEILRVIASSPTDLQPVMDVVTASAARFCGAADAAIYRLEGESLRLVATHGLVPVPLPIGGTAAVTSVAGRAVHDRQTIHVQDIALAELEYPDTFERQRGAGFPARTLLATPLLREGVPIGVISLWRSEVQPFSDKGIP